MGAVPVFVDVDSSGLLDLDLCRGTCARNPHIRALLAVHLYGRALDLGELERLKEDFGLRVVEDCAQSIRATWAGRPTGSVGDVSATSFYPTKNLGAMGDGGAVLTGSAEYASKARSLRHYGQSATYVHDSLGLNSRLDELQAAILHDALLPRVAEWTARRQRTASRYLNGIRHRGVGLPAPSSEEDRPVWHLFPVLVAPPHRPSFVRHLEEPGVATGRHYPRLISEQGALLDYGRFRLATELTRAERFAASEVSLPIHPFLRDDEVAHIIDCCNDWSPE